MKRTSTQYKNMAATLVFTVVLLALIYINTDDLTFRLPVLLVTGGFGLIVAVVFGIRGVWSSLDERVDAKRPLKLASIKGMIIMACVTMYCGVGTVVNLLDAQKGGMPGKVDVAIAAAQATFAIYGIERLLTFARIFQLEKRIADKKRRSR
jgi:hypothetical protein